MTVYDTVIRIPNLPLGAIVDKDGNATNDELTFRHTLITSLQQNFGNEGMVAPQQPTANITIIQNNQNAAGQYTCAPGTIIYDSTTNQLKVAILVAGVPTFKVFTVT